MRTEAGSEALADCQFCVRGVNAAQLPFRVRTVELAIPPHGRGPIGTDVDDRNAIENPLLIRRVGLERFDHEPLIRVSLANVVPTHRQNGITRI
jgi:hypothetical protein